MLTKDSVQLRAIDRSDFTLLYKWHNDIALKKQAMLHPFPVHEINEENWFSSICSSTQNNNVYFIIEYEKKAIGFIRLFNIDWVSRTCWFGIIIGDLECQHKGLGKKALALSLDYAFEYLNLRKMYLEVRADNLAAISLYKGASFSLEGELKNYFFSGAEYVDVLIMGRANSD